PALLRLRRSAQAGAARSPQSTRRDSRQLKRWTSL
ncbi:MAG: hypothetical protein AVDCRST_MAG86-1912, partial [uncultured Truepera sp.]